MNPKLSLQAPSRFLVPSTAILALAFAGGCGGGSGGGDPGPSALTVAMTDGAADSIESFVVDIDALDLTKADGAVVGVVHTPITVDLATLTDTSQFLNAMNVPPGLYDSATITLDFTNASCVLANQSTPATILDANGQPLTGQVVLPMQFGHHPMDAIGGRNRLLEFDFDLDESVDVDLANNAVRVEPTIVLRLDPDSKPIAAEGTLVSVDTSNRTFVADVTTVHGVALGNVTFEVHDATVFQVDGIPAHGTVGLAELNAKPAGTWVQVSGQRNPTVCGIRAGDVYAGTGTYNGGTDIVEGHVIDRSGAAGADPILTVRGRSNNASHTIFQYDTTFTVNASFANTKVVRPGKAVAFDTDDLNVGQKVRVFGTLSGTTMDATATTDVIREQQTRAFGDASGAIVAGTLTMTLNRVDFRPAHQFTWTDGGTTPPDPNAFTVAAGALGTGLEIGSGTPVMARGFFSAVDDNNQDLKPTSLSNLALAPSHLYVRNLPGGFTVTTTTSPTSIDLDITGTAVTGEKATINYGLAGPAPLPTSPTPSIVPAGATGQYVVHDATTGSYTLYLIFADYTSALGTALGSGATLREIGATGIYDPTTNTVHAAVGHVVIE
jgi:hypothetical protein